MDVGRLFPQPPTHPLSLSLCCGQLRWPRLLSFSGGRGSSSPSQAAARARGALRRPWRPASGELQQRSTTLNSALTDVRASVWAGRAAAGAVGGTGGGDGKGATSDREGAGGGAGGWPGGGDGKGAMSNGEGAGGGVGGWHCGGDSKGAVRGCCGPVAARVGMRGWHS